MTLAGTPYLNLSEANAEWNEQALAISRERNGLGARLAPPHHLLALDSDIEQHWALFPKFHDRAIQFIRQYRSDIDPKIFSGQLKVAFVANHPDWKLVALVGGPPLEIIGHLIAHVEVHGTLGPVAFVDMAEKDVNDQGPSDEGPEMIRQWAREWVNTTFENIPKDAKIKKILTMALSKERARLVRKEYGMEEYRYLMVCDV